MTRAGQTTVQIALGGLLLTILLVYGIFQAQDLLEGPAIVITSPTNDTTVNAPLIRVTGNATRISSIELNDRDISVNKNGYFQEPVTLSPGHNIITVEATDRFGRTTTNTLNLVHQPTSNNSLSQTPPTNENITDS